VQFNMSADAALAAKDVLNRLPCQIVFDHLAHMPEPVGAGHPAFAVVVDLLQKAKPGSSFRVPMRTPRSPADLCGLDRGGTGLCEGRARAAGVGSDWPHPSEQGKPPLPDDAVLFDLLAQWAPMKRCATASWSTIRPSFTASPDGTADEAATAAASLCIFAAS